MDSRTLCERAETLIRADARGRMMGDGPRLYVLRIGEHVVCRCHADLADRVVSALEAIALAERGRPSAWARDYGAYLKVLAEVAPLRAMRAGPLYVALEAPPASPGAVAIVEANADLLLGGLDEWRPDVAKGLPMAAVIRDGRAVSICASVRAADVAHTAGVETLPAHRGQGLAAQAVAAWARMVSSLGATAFYATTFDNIASQRVARRVGLSLVGSEFSVECRI